MMVVATLKGAVDLMFLPSQVRRIRSTPLPNDVVVLLRIAAGDEETTKKAAALVGQSCEVVRQAAAFFVEQILLFPDADSYRVLGARPEATSGELRRHMTLLLRWLHPDLDPLGERSVFAARVTSAWNDLKTPERRAAYDRSRRMSVADKSLLRTKGNSQKNRKFNSRHSSAQYSNPSSFHRYPNQPRGLLPRILMMLFRRFAH
jgi:hypothetical protein